MEVYNRVRAALILNKSQCIVLSMSVEATSKIYITMQFSNWNLKSVGLVTGAAVVL